MAIFNVRGILHILFVPTVLIYGTFGARFGDDCESEFYDVQSLSLRADVVVQATLLSKKLGAVKSYVVNKTFTQNVKMKKSISVVDMDLSVQTRCHGDGVLDLVVGEMYFLFLNTSSEIPYSMTALPSKFLKKSRKSILNILCTNCAKAPVIMRKKLKNVTLFTHPTRSLKLVCESRKTKLVPNAVKVYWYKNGIPLTNRVRMGLTPIYNDSISIDLVEKRKGKIWSRLRVKEPTRLDAGEYKCIMSSVLGTDVHTVHVKVIPGERCTGEKSHVYYCLNEGTCYQLPGIDKKYCVCTKGHGEKRCNKKVLITHIPSAKPLMELEKDIPWSIVGPVIGVAVIIIIIAVIIFIIKRRKRRQRRYPHHITNRELGRDEGARYTGHTDVPNGHSIRGQHSRTESQASSYQPKDQRPIHLGTFFSQAKSEQERCRLMDDVDGKAAQKSANIRGRDRLPATSTTPASVHRLHFVSDDAIKESVNGQNSHSRNSTTERNRSMRCDSSDSEAEPGEACTTLEEHSLFKKYTDHNESEIDLSDEPNTSLPDHAGRDPENEFDSNDITFQPSNESDDEPLGIDYFFNEGLAKRITEAKAASLSPFEDNLSTVGHTDSSVEDQSEQ